MQFRYFIEDCPFIVDGTDTGHTLFPMVGEFTAKSNGTIECDALYLANGGIKTRPNRSCRTVFSAKEQLGPDLTSYAGNGAIIESAEAWAVTEIAGEEDNPFDADSNDEHRLGHRELLGRAA